MDFSFRPYEAGDLARCAELSLDAWPIVSLIADNENLMAFMKAYVELSLNVSNYSQICCDNERVIGFLLGSTGKVEISKKGKYENRKLFWRILTGKQWKIKRRFRFLLAFILSTIKIELLSSKFDGELVLFVVDSKYRGRGIGRMLLDNFLKYANAKKLTTIYLSTDIESNWRFYEKYGFKKYRDFYDNGLSVMKGRKITSFIYFIEISDHFSSN